MLLDWLRALPPLRHPLKTSDGRGHIPANLHRRNQHYWSKRRISNQTSSCKKPQIQAKIWITNLIPSSGGSSVPASLAIGRFLVAPPSSTAALARAPKCWTAASHCEKRESSFHFANNASMAACARQERAELWRHPRMVPSVPASTGLDLPPRISICLRR